VKNTVPTQLENLADLQRKRFDEYGDTFHRFGEVFMALFPQGHRVYDVQDANRLALLFHVVDKLTRYANAFDKPGSHPDHLDDLAVYAQILQMLDGEERDKIEGNQ
jgi:hypothetical protein